MVEGQRTRQKAGRVGAHLTETDRYRAPRSMLQRPLYGKKPLAPPHVLVEDLRGGPVSSPFGVGVVTLLQRIRPHEFDHPRGEGAVESGAHMGDHGLKALRLRLLIANIQVNLLGPAGGWPVPRRRST